MHHRISPSFYSPANYVHDIKLNRGDPSNICLPHISSALLFVVDDVHTGMSWGADVGVRRAPIIPNESLAKTQHRACAGEPVSQISLGIVSEGVTGTAKFEMETGGRCLC